jgi:hypothetical protein
MFPYLVDDISTVSNSDRRLLTVSGTTQLEASIDELASLRFSIILTARFVNSPSQTEGRREELSARLAALRRQYSEKIDEIAMTLSVQAAMDAKDKVERTVSAPRVASRLNSSSEPGIGNCF